MKQFFKITLACVLGVLIAGAVGFFGFLVTIISMASMSNPSYTPEKNTILKLKLNTSVTDHVSTSPFDEIINALNKKDGALGLDNILKSIDNAKSDPNIIGIYLNTDGYNSGYATTEAIRNRLKDFKESGKFIVSYNDNYSQKQYYMASVSDSLFLNPVGILSLDGLASKHIFFKNALDKLGVQMQVFRVGTFKSAVEPFITDKMSPANREQTEVYLHSIWNSILSDISHSTTLSTDSLNSLANTGVGFMSPEEVEKTGLITMLRYKSEVENTLKNLSGEKDLKLASISEVTSIKPREKEQKEKIAILYANGEIAGGKTDEGIYWESTIKDINEIKGDSAIKALVLRVNSPGGSAFASEQIWEAIETLKKTKPVVVSMGDYAASGGYYISCNADYIFAEPTTLTGSIGVFGLIPNANELLTKKIGLSFDEVKTNQFGQISIFEPMTDLEKMKIQKGVENIYSLFMKRCAEGRGLSVDSIAKIAEGRVWSGVNAYELGLVDELGGIDKAIAKAATLAGLEKYSTTELPLQKDFIEELMNDLTNSSSILISQQFLGEEFKNIQVLKYIRSLDKFQARMDHITID